MPRSNLKNIFRLLEQLELSGNFQLENSEQAEYLLGLSDLEVSFVNNFLNGHFIKYNRIVF
jgi:hypothetical protein